MVKDSIQIKDMFGNVKVMDYKVRSMVEIIGFILKACKPTRFVKMELIIKVDVNFKPHRLQTFLLNHFIKGSVRS